MSEPMTYRNQQAHARAVAPEDLELFGKKAAAVWSSGACSTLSDAVVSTIKHAHLSPEQVKRVVEFTNHSAYQNEFKKEGSNHRYIDFGEGGPANPSEVLKELNSGGTEVVTRENNLDDYNGPPPEKTASAQGEFEKVASTEMYSEAELANPLQEVISLRDRIEGLYKHAGSELDLWSRELDVFKEELFHNVKIAALSGYSLGELAQVFSSRAPDFEYVKVAFNTFTTRLLDKGVFSSPEELSSSIQKVASVQQDVDATHPLIQAFDGYCQTLNKLASLREEQEELGLMLGELNGFLKQASRSSKEEKGLLEHAWEKNKLLANKAEQAGHFVGEKLWRGTGKTTGKLLKGTAYAVPALAAYGAYQNTVGSSPAVQRLKSTALGLIPGTDEYNMKQYQNQAIAQGMY